jgi:hypothetical protein
MGRRLAPLIVLASALLLPAAASAAWDAAGTPHSLVGGATPQLLFDSTGQGSLRASNAPGYIQRTTDNGATWESPPASYASVPGSNFEYGVDAAGNRVWVWAVSGFAVRVQRTGPGGVPTIAGSTQFSFPNPSGTELKIAVNAAGDALIARNASSSGNVMVAFWKAGTTAPTSAQTLVPSVSGSSGSGLIPYLDPSGSATIVWTVASSGEHSFQSSSPDAEVADSFGPPGEFSDAQTARGAQGSDGRGVLVLTDDRSAPTNSYGQASTRVLKYAGRAPGGSFSTPTELEGDDDHIVGEVTNLGVSPGGAVIVGWRLAINRPGGTISCEDAQLESAIRVATGSVGSGGGLTLSPATVSDTSHLSSVPIAAVGPDGRMAIAWREKLDCPTPPTPATTAVFAKYAAGPGAFVPTDAPPALPAALAFNACGAMYMVATVSSVFSAFTKQAGTPLSCPGGGPGGGGGPPTGGGTGPAPSPPAKKKKKKKKCKKAKKGSAQAAKKKGCK